MLLHTQSLVAVVYVSVGYHRHHQEQAGVLDVGGVPGLGHAVPQLDPEGLSPWLYNLFLGAQSKSILKLSKGIW